MDATGDHVLVLGAERTGRAVYRFLRPRSTEVRVADRSPAARESFAAAHGVACLPDDDTDSLLRGIDLVVTSPGIPREHPVLQKALLRGTPVYSEIELAGRYLTCPILAVSGTNGKSTTTTLLGAMCRAAGRSTFVGGNLGTPLIDAFSEAMPELAVVEVSSFQLEWIHAFHPSVAVMLNLTPDHLDRYASMGEYGEAKAALIDALQPSDFAILNRDDEWVWSLRDRTDAHVISFGREPVEFGSYIDEKARAIVFWGKASRPTLFSLERTHLLGVFNEENLMAAVTAAAAYGLPADAIQRAIDTVEPLPHRLALIREVGGVRWYDDSKATNVGAAEKSVRSFAAGVILLLGGYDKGADFGELAPALRGRVRQVIAFGKAGPTVESHLRGVVPISIAPDLAGAVTAAAAIATAGDVVLLAPACASFDEFRDYNDRGDRYRALVEAI